MIDGEPMETLICFFPNFIKYIFNSASHEVSHVETVHYIYYLMGLTQESWMHKVLKIVYTIPRTLLHNSKMAIKGGSPGESCLRRMCTPASTLIKQMTEKGRVMSVDEYSDYFKDICAENRSIFETIWNSGRERETIYMHHFPFFGIHSQRVHLLSLTYLMAIESILIEESKWEEILPQCHHCQTEQFHIVFIRSSWPEGDYFKVFLPMQLGDMLKDENYYWQLTQEILGPNNDLIIGFGQMSFTEWFLRKYLWIKIPFKMHSLKELSRYQMAVNVFMKRLLMFSEYPLTPLEIDETSLVEETDEFSAEMDKCRQYLVQVKNGSTKNGSMVRGVACFSVITQEDIDVIWQKATFFNMEIMLTSLAHYDAFRQWGEIIGYDKLDQLQGIFSP